MPLIFDPTDLSNTNGVDIDIDVAAKTIEIVTTGSVTNEGATGGVTGQALYSYLKERWKADAEFIKYPFPMEAITPEQFEFINDWEPANDATRKLIRTAGWAERALGAATTKREYIGVVSLGSIGAVDQPYYEVINDGTSAGAQDFTYAGPVNEAVQAFGDVSNGNFDYRETADVFNIFCREAGKTYAASSSTAVGATTLTYITYRFPLSNGTDLSITATDADITRTATVASASFSGNTATYSATAHGFSVGNSVTISGMLPTGYNVTGDITAVTTDSFDLEISDPGSASTQGGTVDSIHANVTIGYYTAGQPFDVNQDLTDEDYSVIITDASGVATTQQIYEAVQYLLRQNVNVNVDGDAGSLTGRVQAALLNFVGSTLETGTSQATTGDGVYIEGLNTSFYAFVKFKADDGVFYLFPKVASGLIQFGQFAGSGDFEYFMFLAATYGTAGAAVVLQNDLATPVSGTYAGTSVPFDFAYTKNTQGGRSEDTPLAVTLIGIGLDGGQFISVDYTINEGSGNNFLIAPAQERNYENP